MLKTLQIESDRRERMYMYIHNLIDMLLSSYIYSLEAIKSTGAHRVHVYVVRLLSIYRIDACCFHHQYIKILVVRPSVCA